MKTTNISCRKRSMIIKKNPVESYSVIGGLEKPKCQSSVLEHCLEVSAILFHFTSLAFLSQK